VRGSQCKFEENNPNAEKNFALEKYGPHSKCFEHTNKMWEEKSCQQTREWQHFGSGCYTYKCFNGRLHLNVGNYTFECFHAGQELNVRIFESGWLKIGAILCPSCDELCGDEFASRGESCNESKLVPSSYSYPKDHLKCDANKVILPSVFLIALAVLMRLHI
jgi:leishmanolysin-like peptidase